MRAWWVWDFAPILLLPLAVFSALTKRVDENDIFIHVLMGRDILSEARFTGNPDWTYGPTNPDWVTLVHWPSQALMALGFDFWGFGFFAFLHAFLAGIFIVVLYVGLKSISPKWRDEVSHPRIAAAALLASIPMVTVFIGPRANAIGAIFAILLGVWLVKVIYSGSFGVAWWVVPLTVWIWTFLHGASLLAAPILAMGVVLWWASNPAPLSRATLKRAVSLFTSVLLALIVPLVTPLGLRAWEGSLAIREVSAGWIYEWSPLQLGSFEFAFTLITLGVGWVAAGIMFIQKRSLRGPAICSAVAMSALSAGIFYQQRNYLILLPVLLLLVVATIYNISPSGDSRGWERISASSRLGRIPLLATAVTGIIIAGLIAGARAEVDNEKFPVEIAQKIASANPDGGRKVFAPLHVAAEVPFYAPGNAVAFDARLDRYPRELLREANETIMYGREDWEGWLFSVYPDTTDMLLPTDSPLYELAQESGWLVTATSPGWVLLSRPGSSL